MLMFRLGLLHWVFSIIDNRKFLGGPGAVRPECKSCWHNSYSNSCSIQLSALICKRFSSHIYCMYSNYQSVYSCRNNLDNVELYVKQPCIDLLCTELSVAGSTKANVHCQLGLCSMLLLGDKLLCAISVIHYQIPPQCLGAVHLNH